MLGGLPGVGAKSDPIGLSELAMQEDPAEGRDRSGGHVVMG
jgi:hypothetical protein